jgi:hypothetical protein
MQRLKLEVFCLAQKYRDVNWDETEGRWVQILNFPLPPGLGKSSISVLIIIPDLYPQHPPIWVYIDKGLGIGSHYFEEKSRNNPYSHLGWAGYCIEVKDGKWVPTPTIWGGSNLLSYLVTFRNELTELAAR